MMTPMFPLGTPLLPGSWLPLQIFELRYQMMLDDCLAASRPEFAVVLIERGSEVGGGEVRSSFGTLAEVVRVDELPDGRRAVLARGTRRIRVVRWLPDDPYPRAEIDDWSDFETDEPSREILASIQAVVERLIRLAVAEPEGALIELQRQPQETDNEHLFRLAGALPLGPVDRQRVLGATGPADRSIRLLEALTDLEAVVAFRRS
jgi:Lon protease-like protein